MRHPDGDGFNPPGVTCRRADLRGQYAQLPLGFMVEFTGGEAKVEVEYLTEVIDADLAEQMLTSFVVLLGDALAQPDRMVADLRLLDDADTARLFRVSRGDDFVCPPMTLGGDLVAEQAIRQPDATAVVYEGRSYSYREINEAANQHAHWLAAQGVGGAEDRVAVLLDKSPELVITALGIAKPARSTCPSIPSTPTTASPTSSPMQIPQWWSANPSPGSTISRPTTRRHQSWRARSARPTPRT